MLLGVGYACSIGGLATMIGTPTNAIFVAYAQQHLGESVSFGKWLLFGVPFAFTLLLVCWQLLVRMFPIGRNAAQRMDSHDQLQKQLDAIGPITVPEKRIMWVFGVVILAWVTGSLLWYKPLNSWIHVHMAGLPLPTDIDKVPGYCSGHVIPALWAVFVFVAPYTRQREKDPFPDLGPHRQKNGCKSRQA